MSMTKVVSIIILTLLLAMGVQPVLGQARGRSVVVIAGPATYDLSGTGTTGFGAVRLSIPIGASFDFEPGLHYFRYTILGTSREAFLITEFQFQFVPLETRVSPYFGSGGGLAWVSSPGDDYFNETVTTALGVRVDAGSRLGFLGELRVRSFVPVGDGLAEFGFGVSWNF